MKTPLPPLSSVDNSAAGPGGRGTVVAVTVLAVASVLEVLDASGDAVLLALEHAAAPSITTETTSIPMREDALTLPRTRPTVVMSTPPGYSRRIMPQ